MEINENIRSITLRDLWKLALSKLGIVILVAAVVAGGMLTFDRLTYTPEYKSTATLYILRQNQSTNTTDAANEFSLALKLVNDCTYMLKSHAVLDQVLETLDLNMSYSEIYDCISTSNPENTRILEVTVLSDSPEKAKQIVDTLCNIGIERITATMGLNQVNLFEYGTLNPEPCNTTGVLHYLLIGVIAAVLTYSVFLVAFLLDDRMRSDDDIEKILGLSILGEIPNADAHHKDGYGYYYAYRPHSSKREDKKWKK